MFLELETNMEKLQWRMARISVFAASYFILSAPHAFSETKFGADFWCGDSGTYCWAKPAESNRYVFNGVRFVAEPKLGVVFGDGKNRINSGDFAKLTLVGGEI